jgi:hypothetical protein
MQTQKRLEGSNLKKLVRTCCGLLLMNFSKVPFHPKCYISILILSYKSVPDVQVNAMRKFQNAKNSSERMVDPMSG